MCNTQYIENRTLEEFTPEFREQLKNTLLFMATYAINSIGRFKEDKILRLYYVDDTIYDVNMIQEN